MKEESGAVAVIAQPQTSGLLTTMVRGTAVSLLASGVTAVAAFVVTPFTIRLFGPEQYGVWAIITTIVSYYGFADLGMSTASTRFASLAYASGDSQKESSVIWTAALL